MSGAIFGALPFKYLIERQAAPHRLRANPHALLPRLGDLVLINAMVRLALAIKERDRQKPNTQNANPAPCARRQRDMVTTARHRLISGPGLADRLTNEPTTTPMISGPSSESL